MQPNTRCQEKRKVIGAHVRADPWSLQPTPSALAETVVGWRTLLEKCGDALLDDGSKQLPFYFAIWRFDGEMWARPPGQGGGGGGRGYVGVCGVGGIFFLSLWREGEQQSERARVVRSVFRGALASLWNSELGTAAASSRCSRGHSPVLLCLPNHRNSFSPSSPVPNNKPGCCFGKHSPLHGAVFKTYYFFLVFVCFMFYGGCVVCCSLNVTGLLSAAGGWEENVFLFASKGENLFVFFPFRIWHFAHF